jgi:GrpB-like predicted nucleotidyltransferase (UPF0157 family)
MPALRRVEIVNASRSWPDEFRRIGHDLRTCLGELALRIDHIGSTSVPGLSAKDVIDVQVTVAALDRDQLAPAFERAGFLHQPDNLGRDHRPPGAQGPDQDWAKLFFSPVPDKRASHVHVRMEGLPNQRYALLFRDYLRAHPAAAAAYAELKRRLAALEIDRRVYAEVKDPACDIIIAAAEEWCMRTGWTAGPSDA